MSQILQLDTLVTMLACLTTTHNDLGEQMLPMDNMTAGTCPLSALSTITTRIQALSKDIASARDQIGNLQEQLVDLRRAGAPISPREPFSIGTRIGVFPSVGKIEGADDGNSVESRTEHNCHKQQHGVVLIRLRANTDSFFVVCDQKTHGGGWIVVAHRVDGSEDFNRKWADYKIGFGPLTNEFFIGLERLYQICTNEVCELLVEMENRNQDRRYALYDRFGIGSESEQYRLNVLGKYQGDATDALREHVGKKFSTQDKDNDESDDNCAAAQSAAFWYGSVCTLSNPFGMYQRLLERDVDGFKGILWKGFFSGPKGSMKLMRFLVRPRTSAR
ncbi:fibrinogen C domain-containing protein 1 [Drosophila grimshawi]|uniref:GH11810 n=1 Tax=Drosophila grimshawi TaxID=7222 RepID=B4JIS7_DROGR|nr:fibrinogen C domain-containing protein 1 [Drosophila grimshawi]EDW00524.1 GH11810 [Drosophila grimshawi]